MAVVQLIVLFGCAVAMFVTAAKTHGRQIRLERELHGIDEVDFRRTVPNHPWVEALWKKDRIGYWIGALVFMVSWFFALRNWGLPLGAHITLAILLGMTLAFLIQTTASYVRLFRALNSRPEPLTPNHRFDDERWKRAASRGTSAWVLLTIALFVGVIASIVSPFLR